MEDFIDIASGKGKDLLIEVNCKQEPIPDLYTFDADLKMVSNDK